MHFMGWIIIVFLAFIALYVSTYYKYPDKLAIHQTGLDTFQFEMLYEKQPLVLDDRVVRLEDLDRLWFSSNITSKFRLQSSNTWHVNKFKYLLLHAEQEGDIYLYPAGKKKIAGGVPDTNESLLAVHLLPGQVMIIPFRWSYLLMEPMQVGALGVHDYITYMLP